MRQQAVKAFREVGESHAALRTSEEMVGLRKEAEKKATTPGFVVRFTAVAPAIARYLQRRLA